MTRAIALTMVLMRGGEMPVFAREREFDTLVYAEAARRGLDPLLIKAVIATESSFNPQALRPEPQINDASRGLMQILYGTAKMMGVV